MTASKPTEELTMLQAIRPSPDQVLAAVGLVGVLPVDPSEVARRLGVNCRQVPKSELAQFFTEQRLEGVSFRRGADGTYWIVYVDEWSENAKRFTVAHELGHVLLHHNHLPLQRLRGSAARQLETEANRFAAGLLMPGGLVRRYASLPTEQVASAFKVSPRAAEIRLASLHL